MWFSSIGTFTTSWRMAPVCSHSGCTSNSSYGKVGTKKAELCAKHAEDGMINVRHKKCGHSGCTKQPSYGRVGTNKAERCARHADDGMVSVRNKKSGHSGFNKQPSCGKIGTKKADLCAEQSEDGIADVRMIKECGHSGCTKQPSYGKGGTKKAEPWADQAGDGMVDLPNKKCSHRGCTMQPSYGWMEYDTLVAEFCGEHQYVGMVGRRRWSRMSDADRKEWREARKAWDEAGVDTRRCNYALELLIKQVEAKINDELGGLGRSPMPSVQGSFSGRVLFDLCGRLEELSLEAGEKQQQPEEKGEEKEDEDEDEEDEEEEELLPSAADGREPVASAGGGASLSRKRKHLGNGKGNGKGRAGKRHTPAVNKGGSQEVPCVGLR